MNLFRGQTTTAITTTNPTRGVGGAKHVHHGRSNPSPLHTLRSCHRAVTPHQGKTHQNRTTKPSVRRQLRPQGMVVGYLTQQGYMFLALSLSKGPCDPVAVRGSLRITSPWWKLTDKSDVCCRLNKGPHATITSGI